MCSDKVMKPMECAKFPNMYSNHDMDVFDHAFRQFGATTEEAGKNMEIMAKQSHKAAKYGERLSKTKWRLSKIAKGKSLAPAGYTYLHVRFGDYRWAERVFVDIAKDECIDIAKWVVDQFKAKQ